MNERIKQLAEQAGISIIPNSRPISIMGLTTELEKFAELIVREAAAFVSGAAEVYNQAEQDACVRASKGLMKHFGVE